MVGGQILDLAAEGRFAGNGPQRLGEEDVRTLQAMKTGALLRFACEAGGMLGSATPPQRKALERYGSAVGQAFQIADDLLDLEGDPGAGRQTDRQRCRSGQGHHGRHPGRRGRKGATARSGRRRRTGTRPFGANAALLIEGANFVANRQA